MYCVVFLIYCFKNQRTCPSGDIMKSLFFATFPFMLVKYLIFFSSVITWYVEWETDWNRLCWIADQWSQGHSLRTPSLPQCSWCCVLPKFFLFFYFADSLGEYVVTLSCEGKEWPRLIWSAGSSWELPCISPSCLSCSPFQSPQAWESVRATPALLGAS